MRVQKTCQNIKSVVQLQYKYNTSLSFVTSCTSVALDYFGDYFLQVPNVSPTLVRADSSPKGFDASDEFLLAPRLHFSTDIFL